MLISKVLSRANLFQIKSYIGGIIVEKNRIFTQEQLDEMAARPTDVMLDAVKAGNKEKAMERLDFIFSLWKMAFEIRIKWDKRFTDSIYENLGGDALYDVWRYRGFTEDQILPMCINQSDYDEAKQLIETLDVNGMEKWIERNYFNFRHSHDCRIEWETILMSHVYEHVSPEACWEAMRLTVHDFYDGGLAAAEEHDFDLQYRIQDVINGLHTHGEKLKVWEDDEKVTIIMEPCGSGTYLKNKGVYRAPQNCSLCSACRYTFSVDKFPIYCIHSPLKEIVSAERNGWIYEVTTPWDLVDDPNYEFAKECCHFQVYKDPKYIPDRVYQMLGMERPADDKINFPGYPGYKKAQQK